MIVVECEQGTQEWFQARAGVITASMFEECRKVVGGLTEQQEKYVEALRAGKDEKEAMAAAGYKSKPRSALIDRAMNGEKVGDYSDKAHQYAFKLAVERISGQLLEEQVFENYAMRRGRDLEPAARLAHEEKFGFLVHQTGIALTDDRCFGASVDGLIDPNGAAEYKCFISPEKIMKIHLSDDISDVEAQVQGQLWVTGRAWSHFVLYCPALESIGLDLEVIEVSRDDDYIEALEADMLKFNDLVENYKTKLIKKAESK